MTTSGDTTASWGTASPDDVTTALYDVTATTFTTLVSVAATTEESEDFPSNKAIETALDILLKFVYPTLIAVGVIANILTLLVVTRPRSRRQSTSLYLTVLAVCDIFVLVLDFINNYPKGFDVNLIAQSHTVCVLYRWLFSVCFMYSAWVVVLLTVERALIVWFPLHAKTKFTRAVIKRVLGGVLFVSGVYNVYNLFAWRGADDECDFADGWEDFHANQNMFVTFAAYSYVPSAILIVANCLIIYRLRQMSKMRSDMQEGVSQSKAPGTDDMTKITITVLAISFSFLIFTVPVSIYYIIQYSTEQHIDMTLIMALLEVIFLLLVLTNHSVNFGLYILTSKSFRQDFLTLLPCQRFVPKDGSSYALKSSQNNVSQTQTGKKTVRSGMATSQTSVTFASDLT